MLCSPLKWSDNGHHDVAQLLIEKGAFQRWKNKLGNRHPQLRLHLGVEVSQRSELAFEFAIGFDNFCSINLYFDVVTPCLDANQ